MTADPAILRSIDAGVMRITLNRPDVLNSCNRGMVLELRTAFEGSAADGSVRAVLLTGAGRAFCAGQDLAEAVPRDDSQPPDIGEIVQGYNAVILAIRRLEKPVVAAVNGVAAGAGANLALACDIVIAAEQASFIQAFVNIGLVPDTSGTYMLPRLIGLARATALMMCGSRVSATDAKGWGMIHDVVPADMLMDSAGGVARHLATQPTRAIGLMKRALNASLTNDLPAQLHLEAQLQRAAAATADFREGVKAFQETTPALRGALADMPLGHGSAIGVLGAGVMGRGIAQLAATKGHPVVLGDSDPGALDRAREGIDAALRRNIEQKRLDLAQAAQIRDSIAFRPAADPDGFRAFAGCALVIEAVVERPDVKRDVFSRLEESVDERCILATNTSSLSIAGIAAACRRPDRVLGLHFFNPAPVMPLVEIVPWLDTAPAVVEAARSLVDQWGKTTVRASDTPGFIVNRIARPYYTEALRILDERIADAPTIDWAMRELGQFGMGPFELMDLIGNDINFAVTRSLFDGLYYEPRYRPSITQQRLVEAGRLGRKTGRGFYDYRDAAPRPDPTQDAALGRRVFERILAMLINEAVDAVHWGVASVAEIDLAVTKGVNYPKGLLAWGQEWGFPQVLARLTELQQTYGEERYRPSVLLKRVAHEGIRI